MLWIIFLVGLSTVPVSSATFLCLLRTSEAYRVLTSCTQRPTSVEMNVEVVEMFLMSNSKSIRCVTPSEHFRNDLKFINRFFKYT